MHRLIHYVGAVLVCLGLLSATADAQLANGGFETGDLSGWSASGSGSIQVLGAGELGSVQPVEGQYFALVGNGPGDTNDDGVQDTASLTSPLFTIPISGGSLSFSWNFLTAEFTGEDADPDHLDRFSILLSPLAGDSLTLVAGDVTGLFTLLEEGNAITAPDGISVIEETGFRFDSFFIPAGTYTLAFAVFDGGDGTFDSALALDDVRVTMVPAVAAPEPGTLLTFGLSVGWWWLCAAGRRRMPSRFHSRCLHAMERVHDSNHPAPEISE